MLTTHARRLYRSRRNRRTHSRLETLEARTLFSLSATAYAVPDFIPSYAAYDSNDNLWVVGSSADFSQTLLHRINASNQVAQTIDLSGFTPTSLAGGNGHLYISESSSTIVDIDITGVSPVITPYILAADGTELPTRLTVASDGAVWFIASGAFNSGNTTNKIGRWVVGASSAQYAEITNSTDSLASSISVDDSDGVWVGINRNFGPAGGQNYVAHVDFNGTLNPLNVDVYTPATGDALSDSNNYVTGVSRDGSGGVWFTFGSVGSDPGGTDMIVHGVVSGPSLLQTAIATPGAGPTVAVQVRGASLDDSGRLWFYEADGTNAHYYDTNSQTFSSAPYDTAVLFSFENAVANSAGEMTVISIDDQGNTILISAKEDAGSVVFGFTSANGITAQEDVAVTNVLIATFTAPALVSGSYTATINWGNSTSSVVTATSIGGNQYAVVVSSKSFPTQGVFNGTVTITSPSSAVLGSTAITSTISDIPLNVTSFAVTPLVLRFAIATATFLDDGDLPVSTWTATIAWGDNTTSTGIIVRDPTQPNRYLVLATHRYTRRGTFNTTITVSTTEANAAIVSATRTVVVTV